MTFLPNLNPAPRGAAGLIRLFAHAEETDLILGDLAEEFSRLALQAGGAVARRWYWRQTLKSLPHLILSAFRAAPFSTSLAVIAGFFLRRLLARLPEFATFALVERFGIYEHHFRLYRFLSSTALDIEHVFTFLLVGGVVGLLARRREMAPAIVLAMIFGAMAVVGSVFGAIRSDDSAYLWRLSWYFTDSLAIILGAFAVKTLRPHPAGQLLHQ
jgi:hypothetical protein